MQLLKKNLIWIALCSTFVLVYFTAVNDEDETEGLLPPKQNKVTHALLLADSRPEQAKHTELKTLNRNADQAKPINIFSPFHTELGSTQALVVDASVAVSQQPIINPYRYEGRVIDQGEYIVFITDGLQNFSVREGDQLNAEWRVLTIMPTKLTLRYVPQKIDFEISIES